MLLILNLWFIISTHNAGQETVHFLEIPKFQAVPQQLAHSQTAAIHWRYFNRKHQHGNHNEIARLNYWRGVLNNQRQIGFTLLTDYGGTQVATKAQESKPDIGIQSNPTHDFITIQTIEAELARFSQVKLIDAPGRVIQSITLCQTSNKIAAFSFNQYDYFHNFSGNNANWSEKVVIP